MLQSLPGVARVGMATFFRSFETFSPQRIFSSQKCAKKLIFVFANNFAMWNFSRIIFSFQPLEWFSHWSSCCGRRKNLIAWIVLWRWFGPEQLPAAQLRMPEEQQAAQLGMRKISSKCQPNDTNYYYNLYFTLLIVTILVIVIIIVILI